MDESIWKAVFDSEMEEQIVPHKWSLCFNDDFQQQQGWLQYHQSTFARFCCSYCTRRWSSAQVHITFLIKLDRTLRCGIVRMKIFRQECKRCTFAILENPEITYENIRRVTSNLVSKIQNTFYEQNREKPMKPIVSGDLDGPHDHEHCEACKLQICQGRNVEKMQKSLMIKGGPTNWSTVQQQSTHFSRYVFDSPVVQRSSATIARPSDEQNGSYILIFIFLVIIIFWALEAGKNRN